jgi:uncharacterized protein YgbK (DUF1537 family)
MSNVRRLIKGSIAALAVVAGGATAMAVVSKEQAPYVATAPELANGAPQSIANRFRSEFAEWPQRPRRHRGHAIH